MNDLLNRLSFAFARRNSLQSLTMDFLLPALNSHPR